MIPEPFKDRKTHKIFGLPNNLHPPLLGAFAGPCGFGREEYLVMTAWNIGLMRIHIPTTWGLLELISMMPLARRLYGKISYRVSHWLAMNYWKGGWRSRLSGWLNDLGNAVAKEERTLEGLE